MEQTRNHDVAGLQRLTASELRARYAEVFGEQPPTWNRVWMHKRLACRLQALAEGGLSERARQRAEELANDADLRMTPPRMKTDSTAPERTTTVSLPDKPDDRLPPPGTILTRPYKSQTVQVQVLQHGFAYAMTPAHTTKGAKRYRYYTCINAQKRGWGKCPSKSIPAAEIEALVIEQIRCIGRDDALLHETLNQAHQQQDTRMMELDAERRVLERDLTRWHTEMQRLSGQLGGADGDRSVVSRLADLQERIDMTERRLAGVREQVQEIRRQMIDEEEARQALASFDPVWTSLTPLEQGRLVALLVQQVNYDGGTGKVAITFHPTSIQALADELGCKQQEMSA